MKYITITINVLIATCNNPVQDWKKIIIFACLGHFPERIQTPLGVPYDLPGVATNICLGVGVGEGVGRLRLRVGRRFCQELIMNNFGSILFIGSIFKHGISIDFSKWHICRLFLSGMVIILGEKVKKKRIWGTSFGMGRISVYYIRFLTGYHNQYPAECTARYPVSSISGPHDYKRCILVSL